MGQTESTYYGTNDKISDIIINQCGRVKIADIIENLGPSRIFKQNECKSTLVYFIEILGDYKYKEYRLTYNIDCMMSTCTEGKVKEYSDEDTFVRQLNNLRTQRARCYFIIDSNSKTNCASIVSLYTNKYFNKTIAFNYVFKTIFDSMVAGNSTTPSLPTVEIDIEKSQTYSKGGDLGCTFTNCTNNAKYLDKVNDLVKSHPIDYLDLFVNGNVYIFIDTERTKDCKVREISVLFTEMQGIQMIPISKLVCKESTPVKTCAQFIRLFDLYVKELIEGLGLGKVYIVGHSISEDMRKIYDTLGLSVPDKYLYLDTAHRGWFSLWNSLCLGNNLTSISLGELRERCNICEEYMSQITQDIFNLKGTSQHTSMFDVVTLYVLVNLLLLKKVDISAYREMHFNLINGVY